jgi:hypothetical protein
VNGIKSQFDDYFAHWRIKLPLEDVADRQRGEIFKAGWTIWYVFGSDERGEFLDFYASHRMSEDSHVRLYADGTSEYLPSIKGLRICADDPQEDKRLEAEYLEENKRVSELLESKGFGLSGGEPLSVAINRVLRTGESQ